MNVNKLIILISFQLFLFCCKDKNSLSVKTFELENGLKVYFTLNRESPEFYAQISVKAGRRYDPENFSGMSHYLEHMLFKGSQKIGTVNFEKEKVYLEKIGQLYSERYNAKTDAERKKIDKKIDELSIKAAEYAIVGEYDGIYQKNWRERSECGNWL